MSSDSVSIFFAGATFGTSIMAVIIALVVLSTPTGDAQKAAVCIEARAKKIVLEQCQPIPSTKQTENAP